MRTASLVLLAGCSGGEDVGLHTPAAFVDALDVEGYETYPSLGEIPFHATVRARNRFGASVPADPTDALSLDGLPVTVPFDGVGYGTVELGSPGSFELTGGEAGPVDVHAVDSDWPGLGLHAAWPSPVGATLLGAAASNGGIAASGPDVWWAGAGAPAHRVLVAESDILGLRRGHLDIDGVLDAVAWTDTTVFLLRGRAGGGMAWGGALAASGHTVASADMGDLSGDNLPDLAIAWIDGSGEGLLDVWEGDGLFGFAPAEPRALAGKPTALALGDASSDERLQVTVLLDTREWARFIQGAPQQYIPIGPLAPVDVLPDDASVLRGGDMQGDGGDDIVVVGPLVFGEQRKILTFDVLTDAEACADGNPDAQCNTEYLDIVNEIGAEVTVGDANDDGYADVVTQEQDGSISAVVYDAESVAAGGEPYRKLSLIDAVEAGPIDLLDVDTDGGGDLLILGSSTWFRWYGEGSDDLENFWNPRPSTQTSVSDDVSVFAIGATSPTSTELVTVRVEGGSTDLVLSTFSTVDQVLTQNGVVEIDSGGAEPTDIAVCSRDAYVVVRGEVVRITLDALGVADDRAGTGATRVDCGKGPGGSSVAMLDSGEAVLLARNLDVITSVDAPLAQDLALGDAGNGPEVRTCATAACSIVFVPASVVGQGRFAVAENDTISLVDGVGTVTPLEGRGSLAVTDVDGDGHLDLAALWAEGDVVTVFRSTGEGLGPAEQWLYDTDVTGTVAAGYGDADDFRDLWALDTFGSLSHTLPPAPRGGPPVSTPTAP